MTNATTPHPIVILAKLPTEDEVSEAIDDAEVSSQIRLVELVNGVHTYQASVEGREPITFVDDDDENAYEKALGYVDRERRLTKARAVLALIPADPDASNAYFSSDQIAVPISNGAVSVMCDRPKPIPPLEEVLMDFSTQDGDMEQQLTLFIMRFPVYNRELRDTAKQLVADEAALSSPPPPPG